LTAGTDDGTASIVRMNPARVESTHPKGVKPDVMIRPPAFTPLAANCVTVALTGGSGTRKLSPSASAISVRLLNLAILSGGKLMPKVLMVEDSPLQARAIMSYFELTEFDFECTERLSDAIERVRRGGVDAVLLDLSLPDSHGAETFQRMQDVAKKVPIVILTSTDDEEFALQLLRGGAQDYLIKGEVSSSWVRRALGYAIERFAAIHPPTGISAPPREKELNLQVDLAQGVTIIRIREKRVVDGEMIEQLGRRLFRLADEEHRLKFLLDCSLIDYVSNAALGQLLVWDQKIRKKGGLMRIFCLRPEVRDQIKIRKLLSHFDICLDEQTALSGI
jgi:anti-anti-sigma factor